MSRTDNKKDKIDYLLKSLSLSQILVPIKTSAASRSFVLGPPTLHQIHSHRSLRAGVKKKIILSSAHILSLSSKAQRVPPSSAFSSSPTQLEVSLLCFNSTSTFTQFVWSLASGHQQGGVTILCESTPPSTGPSCLKSDFLDENKRAPPPHHLPPPWAPPAGYPLSF